MADIFCYQVDPEIEEDADEGLEQTVSLEGLLPVEKLEKYALSMEVYNRQLGARTLLETFRRVVLEAEGELQSVLTVIKHLGEDLEPTVRTELMEQIPHIALFCQHPSLGSHLSELSHVIPQHILPLMVKFLSDEHAMVRKTTQAALLVLLEQSLVDPQHFTKQVCPVVSQLTLKSVSEDLRTEAVALISKIAPRVGKQLVEDLFLANYCALCEDGQFQVRKVCAANLGDIANVIGTRSTQTLLLPKFLRLCRDGVWGVRKACTDVFMPVSCVCSPKARRIILAPLFVKMLKDESKWVRIAAFQALGPFISTFADPSITALLHNDNGEIVITDAKALAERLESLETERADERERNAPVNEAPGDNNDSQRDSQALDDPFSIEFDELVAQFGSKGSWPPDTCPRLKTREIETLSTKYDGFLFWREPLPLINEEDLETTVSDVNSQLPKDDDDHAALKSLVEDAFEDEDSEVKESKSKNESSGGEGEQGGEEKAWQKLPMITFQTFDDLSGSTVDDEMTVFRPTMSGNGANTPEQAVAYLAEGNDPALPKSSPLILQSIVPQVLIDYFVSMTDPSRAETVDQDVGRHCAFSLPAVALTLGRSNWPLLKEAYGTLATDLQWKVRRTLASSIHELAIVLGEETTNNDLLPFFYGFHKDLDEVRIGVLRHLADFLQILKAEKRHDYLPKLVDFLKMDNERNWRFRLELSEQLQQLIPLLQPEEIEEHVSPIALVLVHDRVATVRESAAMLISVIIKSLRGDRDEELPPQAESLVTRAVETLAIAEAPWRRRQAFGILAENMIRVEALTNTQYVKLVLDKVLERARDSVPNVRLAVAKAINKIIEIDFFLDRVTNYSFDRLRETEEALRSDSDVDVRLVLVGYAADVPEERATLEGLEQEGGDEYNTTSDDDEWAHDGNTQADG